MSGKRIVLGTVTVTAALAGAIGAPANAAPASKPSAPHAGVHLSGSAAPPAWLSALTLRSDALNRRYGLGKYGLHPAGTVVEPAWLMELRLRSAALNRAYRLGPAVRGAA